MAKQWNRNDEARFARYKKSVERLGQREGDAAAIAAAKIDGDRWDKRRGVAGSAQAGVGRKPLDHRTIEELYLLARQKRIPGRSRMNKAELIEAISKS